MGRGQAPQQPGGYIPGVPFQPPPVHAAGFVRVCWCAEGGHATGASQKK
jgi:hypothetical protein